jgi:chemotaxis protein CheD
MPLLEPTLLEIYVQPGESHLVRESAIMRTVLGSCVGITFLIPRLGVGALCHPMLPRYPAKPPADASLAAGRRYVDFAIHDLARQFDALHVRRGEVQVKLFGGGDVLRVSEDAARPTVGRLNCEAAIKVLEEEGFAVTASSLRGVCGINIQFNTETGEVLLRRHAETGIARECSRVCKDCRNPACPRKEAMRPGL